MATIWRQLTEFRTLCPEKPAWLKDGTIVHSFDDRDCITCGGTSSVLALPMLNEECPCLRGILCNACYSRREYGRHSIAVEHQNCVLCHGTGRVPKAEDMALLLHEMRKLGFEWESTDQHWYFYWQHITRLEAEHLIIPIQDGNDKGACYKAALKALEAKYGAGH